MTFPIYGSAMPISTSIYWEGYTWVPILPLPDSTDDYGNWYVMNGFLNQDRQTGLHYRILASSMTPQSDYEVKAIVNFQSGNEVGVCGRMDDNGNGYCLTTSWGGGDVYTLSIFGNNDQNPGYLPANAQPRLSIQPGIDYVFKIRFQGNQIFGKVYPVNSPEPGWMVQSTDSRYTRGKVGLYSYGSYPIFKSLSVDILATPTSQSSLRVISPNGGETFSRGSVLNVRWEPGNATSSMVLLELRKANSPYVMINSGAPNTGSYSWTIPSTFAVGNDYKIRITDWNNRNIFDESDGSFSITEGTTSSVLLSPNQIVDVSNFLQLLLNSLKALIGQ
jgi:hypothetical protein